MGQVEVRVGLGLTRGCTSSIGDCVAALHTLALQKLRTARHHGERDRVDGRTLTGGQAMMLTSRCAGEGQGTG